MARVADGDAADGAAARRGERDEQNRDRCKRFRQGYEDGWEMPSSLETASSRVA
jgi:hypothetical protein